MILSKITIVVFFAVGVLSCGLNKQQNEFVFTLKNDGGIRFLLDSATSNNSLYLQPFFDRKLNKEVLLYLNRKKPSILIFDVETQKTLKEVPLQKEGPNGVGRPTGACPTSSDSIYVVSGNTYEISLVNSMGIRLKKFKVLQGDNYNENTGMILSYTYSPAFPIDSKLYFLVAPDRNMYDSKYYNASTNSSLDINTGKYSYFGMFPYELRGKTWGVRGGKHSWTLNSSNNFVSSFSIQDSVVEWSAIHNKRNNYYAGTIFRESKTKPFGNRDKDQDLNGYALETIYYEGLVYDNYRGVYYRIACLPVDAKDKDGNLNDIFNKPISIIILDNDFKIIGESKITDNTYLFYMFFVGKGGLYFAKTNPHYKELEEDYIVFDRFTLSKK